MRFTGLLKACWVAIGLSVLFLHAASAEQFSITSGPNWTVIDKDNVDLGQAQNVCLNATTPASCPQGATLYGYNLGGWAASLPQFPGATWIWAPGITGATAGAADAEYTFQTLFYLCGAPRDGTISVAADDIALVTVNGQAVPGLGPVGRALSTATVPAAQLAVGLNIIQVRVKNGPNPANCTSDAFGCNPAGFVFGGTFSDALDVWPSCTGDAGRVFEPGQIETRQCPPGQTGANVRLCGCVATISTWVNLGSTCMSPPVPPPPPVTCTRADGGRAALGAVEAVSCPAGQTGSASHTCRADGSWSPTDVSACVTPTAAPGEICGNSSAGQTLACPAATECKSRLLPAPPKPWYCVVFNIDCPVQLKTSDWFCDP